MELLAERDHARDLEQEELSTFTLWLILEDKEDLRCEEAYTSELWAGFARGEGVRVWSAKYRWSYSPVVFLVVVYISDIDFVVGAVSNTELGALLTVAVVELNDIHVGSFFLVLQLYSTSNVVFPWPACVCPE